MIEANSTEDVFRFVQVRPPLPVEIGPTVVLPGDTTLGVELPPLPSSARTRLANEYLRTHATTALEIAKSNEGSRLSSLIEQPLSEGLTVGALVSEYSSGGDTPPDLSVVRKHHGNLANFLIAAKFASEGVPRETNELARIYRGFSALLAEDPAQIAGVLLYGYLRRPISLPPAFGTTNVVGATPSPVHGAITASPALTSGILTDGFPTSTVRFYPALENVSRLARPELLHLPVEGETIPVLFTLSAAGLERLTPDTLNALSTIGFDPVREPITNLVSGLESAVLRTAPTTVRDFSATNDTQDVPTPAARLTSEPAVRPYLRSSGVADLLVVKQHLLRYERVDIAHIENVMTGEKKSRIHRSLERTEDTTVRESETVRERETELQTDERFELQRETSKTVQEDRQLGFQLSLSGSYGPSVEFSSNAQLDNNTSTEETVQSSTRYAKDILSRSLDRVTERVREQQQRSILREYEETNNHELNNPTGPHVIGTYQFVEKVYQSQVFNYGIRHMFDFMVPEPASYLWYLETSPATQLNLPAPPPKLASLAPNARAITLENYSSLAALFGAEGITSPPPAYLTVSAALKGAEAGGSEEGHPRSLVEEDVPIPHGYIPFSAMVRLLGLTDNELTMGITIGESQRMWRPRNAPEVSTLVDSDRIAAGHLYFYLGTNVNSREQQSKLAVQVLAYETKTFALTVDVIFQRTSDAYEAWQTKTYDALNAAYRDSVQKYDQDVAELKAKAAAEAASKNPNSRFGAPPSQNLKTVLEELKKHCISIITRQRYEGIEATNDHSPPAFDFDVATDEGSFIRFFEQAFEWDQMQYVFYPYYWARTKTWADRFHREDVDPVFLEFLRSGAARVVVPVRPGFEVAVAHYLETEIIWNGLGNPPEIHSPLYVPIVTEIKERTGASLGEVPVGDPWLTHLPTPLAILRREDNLPEWERPDPNSWAWLEKP